MLVVRRKQTTSKTKERKKLAIFSLRSFHFRLLKAPFEQLGPLAFAEYKGPSSECQRLC